MKISASDNKLETGDLDNQSSFSIKASGKAFKILSDSLYPNKIGAVVRELSCNAYDSHVAARKENIPFEVHLPVHHEPWFSVKDHGVGLDDDSVKKLYTTYFESTKNHSNDFVGAFGLGSKSPFCYTSSFSITSIFNKKKRIYNAFIGEDDIPKISLLHETDTMEENGLEIQVPVNNSDFYEFEENSKKFLKYFDPLPKINVSGFDFKIREPILKGKDWRYFGGRNNSGVCTFIQGHVPYKIYGEYFGLHFIDDFINSFDIEIDFNIGELEVTPSREALSYNKETRENIIKKITLVKQEMKDKLEKLIKNYQGTEWEKSLYFLKMKKDNQRLFGLFEQGITGFQYAFLINFNKFKNLEVRYRTSYSRNKSHYEKISSQNYADYDCKINVDSNVYFFIEDIKVPNSWFKNYFENVLRLNYSYLSVYSFKLNDHDPKELFESLGNPEFLKVSELPNLPRNSRTPVIKSVLAINLPKERESWDYAFRPVEIDSLPEKGLYLDIDKKKIIYDGRAIENLWNTLDNAIKLNYLDGYDKIYIFRHGQKKHIKDNKNWINAFDFLKDKLNHWCNDNQEIYSKFIDNSSTNFSFDLRKLCLKLEEHKNFNKLQNTLFYKMIIMRNNYSNPGIDHKIANLIQYLNFTYDKMITIDKLEDIIRDVYEKYPLITVLEYNSYQLTEQKTDYVIDYILMVEKLTKE